MQAVQAKEVSLLGRGRIGQADILQALSPVSADALHSANLIPPEQRQTQACVIGCRLVLVRLTPQSNPSDALQM